MASINIVNSFLIENQLPISFLQVIDKWFAPLAQKLANNAKKANTPLLVGINGCQGSGKSTLAALLKLLLSQDHQLNTTALSIDDFYLTHEERQQLSKEIYPLLAIRGVPGTHDIPLLIKKLEQLTQTHGEVSIPRFNNAIDDRQPPEQWNSAVAPVDIVILEGWCIGTPAQPSSELYKPINELEAKKDPDAIWRTFVNEQVYNNYSNLYDMIDLLIMLQAPSFDCVYQWRLEQEVKLAKATTLNDQSSSGIMTPEQISYFIQHYQRLTEQSLEVLPSQCDYLLQLDQNRHTIAVQDRL
jgi:D-glycerate 3-kinase